MQLQDNYAHGTSMSTVNYIEIYLEISTSY
jgi:hypothetical protein